jgi:hypothetical protein
VTSDASVGGARRRIEAILCAKQLGFPTAYYTPKTIGFEGTVKVSGVSFFAGGNIAGTNSGNVTIDRATEALYRNWDSRKFSPKSKYNTTPRKGTGVGFGAEGMVCKDEACTTSAADGTNDFDSTTVDKGETNARFIRKSAPEAPQAPSEITYPFDTDASQLVRFLEDEAKRQGDYYGAPQNISSTTAGGRAKYPEDSTDQTVLFMDAQGQTIDIGYSVDYDPKARGTLVIKNGNLRIDDSSNGFGGVIIVTGDGTTTGKYQSSAKNTVEGFVIADGPMTVRGTVAPLATPQDFTARPGFYSVDIWSWRELYE